MRSTSPINALMPLVRQRVLAATLLQPDRSWFSADLARHLRLTPSSLQRELAALTEAGILTTRRQGRMVFFQADTESPIFMELQGLLRKTSGVVDVIRGALSAFADRIQCGFVYGSIARSEEQTRSDIDLMLVGDIRLSEIAAPLRSLSEQFGREVNPKIYGPEEFSRKLAGGDHFVQSVMKKPKLFIFGTENDLGNSHH